MGRSPLLNNLFILGDSVPPKKLSIDLAFQSVSIFDNVGVVATNPHPVYDIAPSAQLLKYLEIPQLIKSKS